MKILLSLLISSMCFAQTGPFKYNQVSTAGVCIDTSSVNITTAYSVAITAANLRKSAVGVIVTNAATLPIIIASGATSPTATPKVLAGGSVTTNAYVNLQAGKNVYVRSATGTTISSGIVCVYPAE